MNLIFTGDPVKISEADYIIICVPTPVTKSKEPDLSYVRSAAETIGRNMKRGAAVVLESTVYPGVTEEVVMPILEKESGFKCGEDFRIAYSPERINPGDEEHAIERITKVVAGMDEKTTDEVASLYSRVAAKVFKARDIKTAEAAKVIENIQRDLNIALMNELSLIFEKMGLSTRDVIDAAATKWNFQVYSPGLIGGHCIPVDPYYLVYKARELGYHPQVILAGRAINDSMPGHVAEMTIKALNSVGKVIKGSRVLIMGLTYKENVADTRETPVKEMIKALKEYGVDIYGYDPLLNDIEHEFGIKSYDPRLMTKDSPASVITVSRSPERIEGEARQSEEASVIARSAATKQSPTNSTNPINSIPSINSMNSINSINCFVDAVVVAVAHDAFQEITLDKLKTITNARPVLIDVREMFDAEQAKERGFYYQTL